MGADGQSITCAERHGSLNSLPATVCQPEGVAKRDHGGHHSPW